MVMGAARRGVAKGERVVRARRPRSTQERNLPREHTEAAGPGKHEETKHGTKTWRAGKQSEPRGAAAQHKDKRNARNALEHVEHVEKDHRIAQALSPCARGA